MSAVTVKISFLLRSTPIALILCGTAISVAEIFNGRDISITGPFFIIIGIALFIYAFSTEDEFRRKYIHWIS